MSMLPKRNILMLTLAAMTAVLVFTFPVLGSTEEVWPGKDGVESVVTEAVEEEAPQRAVASTTTKKEITVTTAPPTTELPEIEVVVPVETTVAPTTIPVPTETVPPTTEPVVAPEPPVTEPAVVPEAPPVVSSGANWEGLAQCEANGDWHINTGNGYYGGLQIYPPTWDAYGGQEFASLPHMASREQQIAVGERILAGQGRGAWPGCTAAGAW